MSKPEFGEPWFFAETMRRIESDGQERIVCDCVGEDGARNNLSEIVPTLAQGRRIAACVSALAGRDPAKLAELEAAAEQQWEGPFPNWPALDRLRSALAAFRKEETA